MDGYILNGPLQMADERMKELYMISVHRASEYGLSMSVDEARQSLLDYNTKYSSENPCDDPMEYFRASIVGRIPLNTVSERLRDDEDFLINVFSLKNHWMIDALPGVTFKECVSPISDRLQDDEYFFARLLKLIKDADDYEVDVIDEAYDKFMVKPRVLVQNIGSVETMGFILGLVSDRIRAELVKDKTYLDRFMPISIKPANK